MMARRPVGGSAQKTTCSWRFSALKTAMGSPWYGVRGGLSLVGRRHPEPNRLRQRRQGREWALMWSLVPDPCDDRAVPALFASYLRVYEPLSAFDTQSQSYWRGYVHDGRAVTLAEGPG